MILGIGTDIVEISRIRKAAARESFVGRVFTRAEAEYCQSRGHGMAASLAGRFAAKEAFMKALGTGLREGRLQEIEILADELGCPHVELAGRFLALARQRGVARCQISISHSREYATALCVLEGEGK